MRAKKTAAKVKKVSAQRTTAAKVASPKTPKRAPAKTKIAKAKTAEPKAVAPKAKTKLPAILLEGDFPAAPPVSGPGEKYALGPTPPTQAFSSGDGDLPEAYGTQRLFLTARDPHWLYANWDLTREQQSRYNRLSGSGHLVLRVHYAPPKGALALEVHVHPESKHWFVHVERAAAKYTSELGYYDKKGAWTTISRSAATLTPPENISDHGGIEFATIPPEVSFAELLVLVKDAVVSHQSLARAIEELRREGHPELPSVTPTPVASWTPAQEQALAEVVSLDQVRRVWIGSMEITELVRRQWEKEISSQSAAQFGVPTSPAAPIGGVSSVSSPFGGERPREKGFWFNVNAELIIYGATERDATVTIGGRVIKLRPDGSFSYRFSLPDGHYDLPVVAVSADGTDGRAAELKFMRSTEIRGEVGAHPQDPELKPPTLDNV